MTDQVETPTRTSKAKPIPKYCWSEGKNTVSVYLELDGLDDVADDAFKVEFDKDQCFSYHRFSRGQAANFQTHWLGERNLRRQSCPKER